MNDTRAHISPVHNPTEVGYALSEPVTDSLYTRTFDRTPKLSSKAELVAGQIQSMSVPDGWLRENKAHLRAGAGLVEFHPAGNDYVSLNSFYRGYRVGQEASRAFKNILSQAPHHLRSHELQSISEVLRDKENNFDIFFASTSDLNGKRVLTVEGVYKDQDHTGSKTIYVDSDGSGSAIQEISYTARGNNYQAHSSEAERAIGSILWR